MIDAKGQLYHEGSVVDSPGLPTLGLSVLRRRRSTFICGIRTTRVKWRSPRSVPGRTPVTTYLLTGYDEIVGS